VHIPKCGGGTIDAVLDGFTPKRRPKSSIDSYYGLEERVNRNRHETYAGYLKQFASSKLASAFHNYNVSFSVMLRNPISLYVSYYTYVNSQATDVAARVWPDWTKSVYGTGLVPGLEKYVNKHAFRDYLKLAPKLQQLPSWWKEEFEENYHFPGPYNCSDYSGVIYSLLSSFKVVGKLEGISDGAQDFFNVFKKKSHLFTNTTMLSQLMEKHRHIHKSNYGHISDESLLAVKAYLYEHSYCEFMLWEAAGQIEQSDLSC
jgi:hypothetical protein